jgi:hypothetical protein
MHKTDRNGQFVTGCTIGLTLLNTFFTDGVFSKYSYVPRSLAEQVLEELIERVGLVLGAVASVELVLELDPMETEAMQEAFKQVHAHDNGEGHCPEDWPQNESL